MTDEEGASAAPDQDAGERKVSYGFATIQLNVPQRLYSQMQEASHHLGMSMGTFAQARLRTGIWPGEEEPMLGGLNPRMVVQVRDLAAASGRTPSDWVRDAVGLKIRNDLSHPPLWYRERNNGETETIEITIPAGLAASWRKTAESQNTTVSEIVMRIALRFLMLVHSHREPKDGADSAK